MNTPKSQNPDGKVVAVGYISPEALAALNVCRNDEHNGCADIWMRPVNVDDVPLIPATALADMQRERDHWRQQYDESIEVCREWIAENEAMQRRLEAALKVLDDIERSAKDKYPRALVFVNDLRNALLRGDGKGEGVSNG